MSASFTTDQVSVGQQILSAVKGDNLSPADTMTAEIDAIMAAYAESGIANINYGDFPSSMGGQMSSSRGPFQQISAWGPLSDRTNVITSTQMFLNGGQAGQTGLTGVSNWNSMNGWDAVQSVQQSEFADGSNYQAHYQDAIDFVTQYGSGAVPVTSGGGNGGGSGSGTRAARPVGYSIKTAADPKTQTNTGTAPPDPIPSWIKWFAPIDGVEAIAKGGSNVASTVTSTVNSVTQWAGVLTKMLTNLISPSFWLRVFAGIGGLILLVLAGYAIATSN